MKKVIAIDFDGVIHRFSKGWKDGDIYDQPVKGVENALEKLSKNYELKIFTAREKLEDVKKWLKQHNLFKYFIEVTNVKPPAECYIDDRGLRFDNRDNTLKRIPKLLNKSLASQLTLFGSSREGETKPGKTGALVLKKNPSGKGASWNLLNKKQKAKNSRQNTEVSSKNKDSRSLGGVINTKKAYNYLSDNLGNLIEFSKDGKVIDQGKFTLVNENNDGSLSLFLNTKNDGEQIIPISKDQGILYKKNMVSFRFADKNINIYLDKKPGNKSALKVKLTEKRNNLKLVINPQRSLKYKATA